MAEPATKSILPLLEGEAGERRLQRFWQKVDVRGPNECWLWTASMKTTGYGRFKLASYEQVTASRVALISSAMSEPEGMCVLHRCDNPPCCNPAHLFFGTNADNVRDKVEKGRARTGDQTGTNNGNARIDEHQLELIVARLKAGWSNTRIAADLPITHSMVSTIRRGKMWRAQTAELGWEPRALFKRPPSRYAA